MQPEVYVLIYKLYIDVLHHCINVMFNTIFKKIKLWKGKIVSYEEIKRELFWV